MWCCSKAAAPVRVTTKRRPTLSASAMFAVTQAHLRWVSLIANSFQVWRCHETPPKHPDRLIQAFDLLLSVAYRFTGKRLLHRISMWKRVKSALETVVRLWDRFLMQDVMKPACNQWRQFARSSVARARKVAVGLRSISGVARRCGKLALSKSVRNWREIAMRHTAEILTKSTRFAMALGAFGRKLAIKTGLRALERNSKQALRIKTAVSSIASHCSKRRKPIFAAWKRSARRKTNRISANITVKVAKFVSVFRRYAKFTKSHSFLRWKSAIALLRKRSDMKLAVKTKICTRVATLISVNLCEKGTFQPAILRKCDRISEGRKAVKNYEEINKFTATLFELSKICKNATRFAVQKWSKKSKFALIRLKTMRKPMKLFRKSIENLILRIALEKLKNTDKKAIIATGFSRLTSHHRLITARSFLKWSNITANDKRKLIPIANRFLTRLSVVINHQKARIINKIVGNDREKCVKLRLLSLLARKRVETSFSCWKSEKIARNSQEMWSISRLIGVKRFILSYKSRYFAYYFSKLRSKARIKSRIAKCVQKIARNYQSKSECLALIAWKKSLFSQKRYQKSIRILQQLGEKRSFSALYALTRSEQPPTAVSEPQRRAKSWLQMDLRALGTFFQESLV